MPGEGVVHLGSTTLWGARSVVWVSADCGWFALGSAFNKSDSVLPLRRPVRNRKTRVSHFPAAPATTVHAAVEARTYSSADCDTWRRAVSYSSSLQPGCSFRRRGRHLCAGGCVSVALTSDAPPLPPLLLLTGVSPPSGRVAAAAADAR